MYEPSKISQISGKRLNNVALIQGLRDCHIRRRVAKEQESWIMLENVYKNINKITKSDACTKAYHEPRYDTISEVATEEVNEVSYNKGKKKQNTYDKSYSSSNFRYQYNGSQYKRN